MDPAFIDSLHRATHAAVDAFFESLRDRPMRSSFVADEPIDERDKSRARLALRKLRVASR